jgi:hypothetical protein
MKLRSLTSAAIIAAVAGAVVVVSAGVSEAKAKKKEAAPQAPPPVFCPMIYAPVCAVKGDIRQTYANACFARKDGAKIVSEGPCKPKPAAKPKKKKSK